MTQHFRVLSPFVVLKDLNCGQAYLILPVGAIGEILPSRDNLEQPGLVQLKVDGETFVAWTRDLQQCTDVLAAAELQCL